jgi:hypothetical protein
MWSYLELPGNPKNMLNDALTTTVSCTLPYVLTDVLISGSAISTTLGTANKTWQMSYCNNQHRETPVLASVT